MSVPQDEQHSMIQRQMPKAKPEKIDSIKSNSFHMIIILQLTQELESRTFYHFMTLDEGLKAMYTLFMSCQNHLKNPGKPLPDPLPSANWEDIETFFHELPDFAAFVIDATIGGYRSFNQSWLCNELYQYLYPNDPSP